MSGRHENAPATLTRPGARSTDRESAPTADASKVRNVAPRASRRLVLTWRDGQLAPCSIAEAKLSVLQLALLARSTSDVGERTGYVR